MFEMRNLQGKRKRVGGLERKQKFGLAQLLLDDGWLRLKRIGEETLRIYNISSDIFEGIRFAEDAKLAAVWKCGGIRKIMIDGMVKILKKIPWNLCINPNVASTMRHTKGLIGGRGRKMR